MRISTSMIFDAGISGMGKQTSSLLDIQQQVASGKRIRTPSDDPVAAARALELQRSTDMIAQYKRNQQSATSSLSMEESQLGSAVDNLQRVRELTLQARSASTDSARKNIAVELRSRFDELLGIANSGDGEGNRLFGGYASSGAPFSGSVDAINAGGSVAYGGDDGNRQMQVSPTRFINVSDPGSAAFLRIPNGNGVFATAFSASNTGTGTISVGTVADPTAWAASATQKVDIKFTVTGGVTTYDLVDTVTNKSLLTGGAAPAPLASQRTYSPGAAIPLKSQGAEPAFDVGGSVVVSGAPATGDSFSLTPSTSQSVFKTLANLIGALETPVATDAAKAQLSNSLSAALDNVDSAVNVIGSIRAQVGARLNEIDALASSNEDMTLQYKTSLSNLQDIDYAEAITKLTQHQTQLQAAQQSFMKISQLSLFNYL